MNILEISSDGSELYIGGSNVQKVKNSGKETKQSQLQVVLGRIKDNTDYSIRDLRLLEDGRILVHQAGSNNIIVYDKNMKVVKEMKGSNEKYDCMM